ncbi:MAG: DUF3108 domain-containing protein [Bacteroidetes bacterium HGW-Bacteroidetes-21]|jgi:hypothetical protein|nr:MAG: DUF3108 domain-containing protein [Bacteroidetes bacterium HGW-Bacteroidetes-21]
MKIGGLILLIVLLWAFRSEAQCYSNNTTFKNGERISYNIWYQWGPVWVEAGTARFHSDSMMYNNQPAYRIRSWGNSLESWDWFFKVRDFYEVYMQISPLKPLEFSRKNMEGGFFVDNHYVFDYQKNVIYSKTENTDKKARQDTLAIKSCTHDLLSAIIYTRNLDYSKVQVNQKIPVQIIIDAEFYPLYLRYLGKETIKGKDKKTYKCIKLSVMLVEGTMFNAGENMTVWVTDDNNHVPVLIEAKILVGSVKAYLNEYSGLRYPFEAIK